MRAKKKQKKKTDEEKEKRKKDTRSFKNYVIPKVFTYKSYKSECVCVCVCVLVFTLNDA